MISRKQKPKQFEAFVFIGVLFFRSFQENGSQNVKSGEF